MTWFFALVIVAVLGVIAVVAAGRGGSMPRAYDDRPDALVPADRPLTSSDLRRVRLTTAFRGYRMSEVDALLDRLAAELNPDSGEDAEREESARGGPARGDAGRADPPRGGPASGAHAVDAHPGDVERS